MLTEIKVEVAVHTTDDGDGSVSVSLYPSLEEAKSILLQKHKEMYEADEDSEDYGEPDYDNLREEGCLDTVELTFVLVDGKYKLKEEIYLGNFE